MKVIKKRQKTAAKTDQFKIHVEKQVSQCSNMSQLFVRLQKGLYKESHKYSSKYSLLHPHFFKGYY